MKLKAYLLATAILLFSTLAWGADNRRDGNWWLAQEKYARAIYLVGFLDGMELGKNFSAWKHLNGTAAQQECGGQAMQAYNEYSEKCFNNVTAGQLSAGLDSFYADYRNRRIRVHAAVWLVVNGIAGAPEEELKKRIESWRRNSGD